MTPNPSSPKSARLLVKCDCSQRHSKSQTSDDPRLQEIAGLSLIPTNSSRRGASVAWSIRKWLLSTKFDSFPSHHKMKSRILVTFSCLRPTSANSLRDVLISGSNASFSLLSPPVMTPLLICLFRLMGNI
jgi:hypothetical protein